MNDKTCPHCKQRYEPIRSFQKHCLETACIEKGNEKLRETKRKVNRKALKQFNDSDMSKLKRKTQTVCNQYIRLRDGKKCISCGFEGSKRQFHAGHFLPQGGNSLLRYDESNIHSQCSICNNYKSGNLVPYRINLIEKIGLDKVEEMESMRTIKKWTADELKEIIEYYKNKIKELS